MFEIDNLLQSFFKAPRPLAYREWVRCYEEMTVHTQGKKPRKLIETRRPYEDVGIQEYRLESFQPITKDAINRAIQNLQRLFSNGNFTIKFDPEINEYINDNNFEDKDLISYISTTVVRRMIEDPNGCLVWWPKGEGLEVPTISVEVEPILVLSKSIKILDSHSIVWLSTEKSNVRVGNKDVMDGDVYYVASVTGFYKFVQFGKKHENRFALEEHYLQEFEYAPYIILDGEATQITTEEGVDIEFKESFFSTYLPSANLAIGQFSDHQGIMVTSAFPIREMEPIECVAEGCSGGFIHEKGKERRACATCNGTGYVAPPSPYGVLVRPKPQGMSEERVTVPALRYISPDEGICRYSGEVWREHLKDAEKALNLIFIDEAQSGTAKMVDREDKEAAIDRIGSNVFNNIVKNSLIIIGDLRTIGTAAMPVVYLPPTFRVKSEKEVVQELSELRNEGAPDFVIAEATREFMQRRYGSNPAMIRMVNLLAEFDTFFALSTKEKQELLASGGMEEREYLFSLHAPKYLRVIIEDEDFMSMSKEAIKSQLDTLLQAVINRRPIDGTLDA